MHDDHPAPRISRPVWRVGVDLTAVGEVADSLTTQGERYLRRLFTDHEVASSEGPDGPVPESLAARFAAKEAALKVLRPTGSRPEWRDIEVRRGANGACDLVLHGSAAALAADQGIEELSLSLSHEGGMAVAVVVGWGWPVPDGAGSS
jgi:holo-[acyl-carrier protein] synthase